MDTIQEAKAFLRANFNEGVKCPCCAQQVKLYKYNLFSTSASALIRLYRLTMTTGKDYHHVRDFAEATKKYPRASHFADLRHWGLVEAMDKKTSTENSSGMWRMTEHGIRFVQGRDTVKKKVTMYNNMFYGLEGEPITIHNALGNKFDYDEIMNGN